MKRILPLILILSLLVCGCSVPASQKDDSVTFYYLNSDYDYGKNADVIVPEVRESTGQQQTLSYMMALYLMGPVNEKLEVPLPSGTRIYKAKDEGELVHLYLSDSVLKLTPEQHTVACACLALTCFDLTDAETVCIYTSEQTVTMSRSSLTLTDDSTGKTITEETK